MDIHQQEFEQVSIAKLHEGAAIEMIDEALTEAWANIWDPNTEAKKKRAIHLTITLSPDEERDIVTAGITKVNEIEVKNPVTLRPFRTFAEVEQPQSKFIVRLRDAKEGMPPGVALFEVADYSWKLKAMLSIKQYLAAKLEGSELPIFA